MTLLSISQDTLIQLPDGASGAAVTLTYNGTTTGSVIASGDDQGRAVIVSGRLAKLTALDKTTSLQVVGRESGGRMPARITLRIYPEYPAGKSGPVAPITLSGLPVGAPDAPGIWDLSNVDDASGGLDVVTPAERQSMALLRERTADALAQAEAQQVAVERAVGETRQVGVQVRATTDELRSVAGTYSLGREPRAGDPAGMYRWADDGGDTVDIAWDGQAETGRSSALVTAAGLAQRLPVYASDYGFGAAGNSGAQNKTALAAALSVCYAQRRYTLILPDADVAQAIPLASGTLLSSSIHLMAQGICYLTPSDGNTYLFNVKRGLDCGDNASTGEQIAGQWTSDEMARASSGGMSNLKFRNHLDRAGHAGYAVQIGDADAAQAQAHPAAQGVGFTLRACHFGGLQHGVNTTNNLWLVRIDQCDFSNNERHLLDNGNQNKGENMLVTRSNFHDSATPYSIEFAADMDNYGAVGWKFDHCSFDYNTQPFAFSGTGYQVEFNSCWIEWGEGNNVQVINTDAAKNNTMTVRGGAIVYTGTSASRFAGNGVAGHLMITTDRVQFRRTSYIPIHSTGTRIVYVDPGQSEAFLYVPFAHRDAGLPVVIPMNGIGNIPWWVEGSSDPNKSDELRIILGGAAPSYGAKFLVYA